MERKKLNWVHGSAIAIFLLKIPLNFIIWHKFSANTYTAPSTGWYIHGCLMNWKMFKINCFYSHWKLLVKNAWYSYNRCFRLILGIFQAMVNFDFTKIYLKHDFVNLKKWHWKWNDRYQFDRKVCLRQNLYNNFTEFRHEVQKNTIRNNPEQKSNFYCICK